MTTPKEVRDKLQSQILEFAAFFLTQSESFPLVYQDITKKHTVHQQWGSSGPETVVRITQEGLTPELVAAFCYNYIQEFPKIVTNIEMTKLSAEDNRTIFHQKINTPFIFPNISIIQCQYNIHNEGTGEYTFVISSVGNDAI
jgi:hypothetical protein